jgi:hypothetical protein
MTWRKEVQDNYFIEYIDALEFQSSLSKLRIPEKNNQNTVPFNIQMFQYKRANLNDESINTLVSDRQTHQITWLMQM